MLPLSFSALAPLHPQQEVVWSSDDFGECCHCFGSGILAEYQGRAGQLSVFCSLLCPQHLALCSVSSRHLNVDILIGGDEEIFLVAGQTFFYDYFSPLTAQTTVFLGMRPKIQMVK